VYVLPYPAQLECQEGIRQRLEAELTRVVHAVPAAVRVKLVFARSREDAYLGLLPRRSMVVMAAPDRWWPTQEERLARKLAAAGHSVAVIRVK
jgi:acetyl esterase/lipase